MSINAVGVGSLVYKKEAEMRKIAGTDGKVFLYADFALLTSHFDEIIESACSKFLLLFFYYYYSFSTMSFFVTVADFVTQSPDSANRRADLKRSEQENYSYFLKGHCH